jgi:protein-L-isoaspartate(D-aspartate) O-methyltransferase
MNSPDFAKMRRAMIDSQLRTSGVSTPWIVAAMGRVPREQFVPADRATTAYMDRAVPLGGGRALNPPLASGLMVSAAEIRADDRVLIIGDRTGYIASLIADRVTSVIVVDTAGATAPDNLANVQNVDYLEGPLNAGAPDAGPFSLILIDGTIKALPAALVTQVKDGGRIVTGLSDGAVVRLAMGFKHNDVVVLRAIADCEIALLPGFEPAKEFVF